MPLSQAVVRLMRDYVERQFPASSPDLGDVGAYTGQGITLNQAMWGGKELNPQEEMVRGSLMRAFDDAPEIPEDVAMYRYMHPDMMIKSGEPARGFMSVSDNPGQSLAYRDFASFGPDTARTDPPGESFFDYMGAPREALADDGWRKAIQTVELMIPRGQKMLPVGQISGQKYTDANPSEWLLPPGVKFEMEALKSKRAPILDWMKEVQAEGNIDFRGLMMGK